MKIIVKNPPRSTLYLSVWVHGKTYACTLYSACIPIQPKKILLVHPKSEKKYGAINLLDGEQNRKEAMD